MGGALAIRLLISFAIVTFLGGARISKGLLIGGGILLVVAIAALTVTCFSDKGFGVAALLATLKGLVIVLPMAVVGAAGALIGWGLRKMAGLPADGLPWG
jgi:hypothetical protein